MDCFSSRLPGHQEAIAVCLHIQTQQIVNDSLCDMVHRPPAMSQACNMEPCPPRYVVPYADRREMLSGQQHPPKRNSLCTETHRLIREDQPSPLRALVYSSQSLALASLKYIQELGRMPLKPAFHLHQALLSINWRAILKVSQCVPFFLLIPTKGLLPLVTEHLRERSHGPQQALHLDLWVTQWPPCHLKLTQRCHYLPVPLSFCQLGTN